MTVDEYLRSRRGVPTLPQKWRWDVTRSLSGEYDISIIDEQGVNLSSQSFEPQGLSYDWDDSTFLTTVKGAYYRLYSSEIPEFSEVRSIISR